MAFSSCKRRFLRTCLPVAWSLRSSVEGRPVGGGFHLVKQMVADLEQLRKDEPDLKIGKPSCFADGIIGSRLTSADKKCTLINVPLGTPFLALQTQAAVDQAKEACKNVSPRRVLTHLACTQPAQRASAAI